MKKAKTKHERWLSRPHHRVNPCHWWGRVLPWAEYCQAKGIEGKLIPVTEDDVYCYIYYANTNGYNVIGEGVGGEFTNMLYAVRKGIIENEYLNDPMYDYLDKTARQRIVAEWVNNIYVPLEILLDPD